jgi:hypothetical protein
MTYISFHFSLLAPMSWQLSQPGDYFDAAYILDPPECPLMISRLK